jgi:hypothetical protein
MLKEMEITRSSPSLRTPHFCSVSKTAAAMALQQSRPKQKKKIENAFPLNKRRRERDCRIELHHETISIAMIHRLDSFPSSPGEAADRINASLVWPIFCGEVGHVSKRRKNFGCMWFKGGGNLFAFKCTTALQFPFASASNWRIQDGTTRKYKMHLFGILDGKSSWDATTPCGQGARKHVAPLPMRMRHERGQTDHKIT